MNAANPTAQSDHGANGAAREEFSEVVGEMRVDCALAHKAARPDFVVAQSPAERIVELGVVLQHACPDGVVFRDDASGA